MWYFDTEIIFLQRSTYNIEKDLLSILFVVVLVIVNYNNRDGMSSNEKKKNE